MSREDYLPPTIGEVVRPVDRAVQAGLLTQLASRATRPMRHGDSIVDRCRRAGDVLTIHAHSGAATISTTLADEDVVAALRELADNIEESVALLREGGERL